MATSALSDLTKMPVMPKLPKTAALVQPEPTPKGMIGGAEIGPVLSELNDAETQAALKVAEGEIAIKQAEREEKATEAMMKAEELGRFSEKVQAMPERQTLQQARDELANKAFVPTKDNATDLAAMFSLINIVGMLVGKSDAQRSMYAMNGMLEGYQKGRADLYKKEQIEFDKNFKALQAKVATLEKGLAEAMEVAKIDKEKGDLMVTMALAKADSPVLKAMRLNQGDIAVLQNVRRVKNDVNTVAGLINSNAQEANRREEAAEAMAQRERHQRENAARAERMAKEKMSHAEKIKELKSMQRPASATNERYANTVYRASNEVLRSLELVERLGITVGGGVLGNVVGKGTIPSEVQRYLGQSMTDEQQRNYNTAMSGISLELAYVLNGGYKPNEGQINKLETLLAVGPNDTFGNAAYKFADVSAKLKAAVEVSPTYSDDQQKTKQMLMDKMNRYATPEQVQDRIYGSGKAEEPVVRAGKVYEPQTDTDFNDIPSGELYKDPADGKIYRKKK